MSVIWESLQESWRIRAAGRESYIVPMGIEIIDPWATHFSETSEQTYYPTSSNKPND
jgi:hypothetical protein